METIGDKVKAIRLQHELNQNQAGKKAADVLSMRCLMPFLVLKVLP